MIKWDDHPAPTDAPLCVIPLSSTDSSIASPANCLRLPPIGFFLFFLLIPLPLDLARPPFLVLNFLQETSLFLCGSPRKVSQVFLARCRVENTIICYCEDPQGPVDGSEGVKSVNFFEPFLRRMTFNLSRRCSPLLPHLV